jgi:hypothetical protein
MFGPKDGAYVPEILWLLPVVELQEKTRDGIFIHRYVLNDGDNNYYYAGVIREEYDEG